MRVHNLGARVGMSRRDDRLVLAAEQAPAGAMIARGHLTTREGQRPVAQATLREGQRPVAQATLTEHQAEARTGHPAVGSRAGNLCGPPSAAAGITGVELCRSVYQGTRAGGEASKSIAHRPPVPSRRCRSNVIDCEARCVTGVIQVCRTIVGPTGRQLQSCEEAVVPSVRSDPEPGDLVIVQKAKGAVSQGHANGVDGIAIVNLLELKAWVASVVAEQPIRLPSGFPGLW